MDRAGVEDAALTLLAQAVLAAAGTRTESRGCHVRTDFPDRDDTWQRESLLVSAATTPAGCWPRRRGAGCGVTGVAVDAGARIGRPATRCRDLRRVVDTALAEDLRYGPDATTAATVPGRTRWRSRPFATRQPGVLAGLPAVRAVLDAVVGELRGAGRPRRRRPAGARATSC